MVRQVVALMCLLMAIIGTDGADWAKLDRYHHDNERLMELPDSCRRVVFYGNSITDFWDDNHPEFFSANGFVDRGISGQTTYQFLTRFRKDVVDLHPRLVVLNGAINDIAENTHPYDEDLTMGNIQSMVEIARANNIDVILTSLLPAGSIYWRQTIADVPAKIESLNNRLKAYAQAENIPFVDYFSALVAADGYSLRPDCTVDGLHPTAAGYEIMESVILPVVSQALRNE